MDYIRECEYCAKGFTTRISNKKFCCDVCRERAQAARKKLDVNKSKAVKKSREIYVKSHVPQGACGLKYVKDSVREPMPGWMAFHIRLWHSRGDSVELLARLTGRPTDDIRALLN